MCASVAGQPPEGVYTSSSTCAQLNAPEYYMNATCPANYVIAINKFNVAAKRIEVNCTADTAEAQFEQCCSSYDANVDCVFEYSFDPFVDTHSVLCNGKTSCQRPGQQVDTYLKCNQTVYDRFSANYMDMEIFCIEGNLSFVLIIILHV